MTMGPRTTLPSSSELRAELDAYTFNGWMSGTVTPSRTGTFERQTTLGTRLDRWTGREWVRGTGYPVACANQALPWRELVG